ncbi:hypothetical protein OY671_002649 [Metschnikowia pulcherrima]|nr:hypothetical protein OY671_002649 [Metschnikowia pulcherrima]
MSLSRGTGTDRKAVRRGAKKAQSFKENHVLIGPEAKKAHKRRKDDRHVAVESAEFQLLVKLYVPANLLIKNNKVSMKQLTFYLPVLVSEQYPELNFEIHIFLSSLVTAYVSSWYCEKLNTDSMAFVHDVYETLCAFVKDTSSRVSGIVKSERFLHMVNELARIMDKHLRDNFSEEGVPRFASKMMESASHGILEDTDFASLKARYLKESHISFDETWAAKDSADSAADFSKNPNNLRFAGTDIHSGSHGSARQTYLRVLVKNILRTAFSESNLDKQGPRDSVIVTNLLTILLADLVLGKLIAKLSSPEFLISTVMGGITKKFRQTSNTRSKPEGVSQYYSWLSSLKESSQFAFGNLFSAMVSVRQKITIHQKSPIILFSPVFSLIDAILNVTGRKPIVASILNLARSSLWSITNLGQTVESFAGSFLMENIAKSSIVSDHALAHLVESLRCSLFEKSTDSNSPKSTAKTTDEVASEMLETLKSICPSFLTWLAYANEDEQETKLKIEATLKIFDCEDEISAQNSNGSESDMNVLLVMKILDCLVQNIYPEMTTELTAAFDK